MRKIIILYLFACISTITFAQQSIKLGKGSYAEYPSETVAYDDGYFAAPYSWFKQAWSDLNLHENVRNRPIPTNKWWSDFIFKGLGRIQPEYHQPPVTVTTNGSPFGTEAWAYPHVVKASKNGFEILFPKGFNGGGMNRGNPMQIHATSVLQANDENIVFADFESSGWPTGWRVSNNTQNISGPMASFEITQSPKPNGYIGERFVNSYKGDGARLTLTSPKFTIEKNYIRLYVGGGNSPDLTYVGLFINGEKVRSASGENSGNLKQQTWDVSEYKGVEAEIRIVDDSGGGWGFIMCDEIIFTDSQFGGSGYSSDFQTLSANVYDWTDLGFTLRSENNSKKMDATIIHGVPFVYIELDELYPILVPGSKATAYNASGNKIESFPVELNVFAIEFDERVFGVHMPKGSKIHRSKGGDFQIETPGDNSFVVISTLPKISLLTVYDNYARNKPQNTTYHYEYRISEGKIQTSFDMDTENLENGNKGGYTLMSFLPHHYRTTTRDFDFISEADYQMFIGKMYTAAGKTFTLSYDFGGMPPYLPEPLDLSDGRKTTLNELLEYASQHYSINGNTYAKGLGENSTLMLMAKSMDNPSFDLFRNNLKNEFSDWFTFSESEREQKQRYFAKYPNYGGVIGFPPGYGSQGFNDLHFHNGYFTIGAARLMMVDKEFKRDFSEMTKLITQTYANWERYDKETGNGVFMPFLRTFDPYLGHSFAGGTGDGGGNNQESTSEAINSWFGVYLLGIELNDKRIIDTGAMGYMLEVMSAGEYWLDLYDENFSSTYEHDYVGILRTDNLAWATYFAGDPAWVLGIQACPVDFFFTNFGIKPEKTTSINTSMFHDRTTFYYDGKPMHTNDDPYDNIKTMGPYLGGYHLNIMNYTHPEHAALWVDDFCKLEGKAGEEWRNHKNTATNYYLSNAMITYGKPAIGYHTSIASGAVYKNNKGELTYLLYNPTDVDVGVDIYKDNAIIETIKVGAGVFYNSRITGGHKPATTITSYKDGDKMALDKEVKIIASATDRDGEVMWVDFYFDNTLIGTSYAEPYEMSFAPSTAGMSELKAIAVDNEGKKSDPSIIKVEVLASGQTPYIGRPWNIPQDKILAVQFDNGGAGIACHDNEIEIQGGNNLRADTGIETENSNNGDGNIGYTNAGEWLEYTVDVQKTGVYAMSIKMASAGGGALRVEFNGIDKNGSIAINNTGTWGNYKDTTIAKVPLQAGKQIMRIIIDKRGVNLSSYTFTLLPGEKMPPLVNAGETQIIFHPQNMTSLSGIVETHENSNVTEYEWSQTDGNAPVLFSTPNQVSTEVSNLKKGTYIFELKATDSNGLSGVGKVIVLVREKNFAPIAHPGNSLNISASLQELMLDASRSFDPDGTINKYEWLQIDNNNRLKLTQNSTSEPTATLSGFQEGKLYVIRLTVTDNEGVTGSNNIRIVVDDTSTGAGLSYQGKHAILIYPTPFRDKLSIKFDESSEFELARIYALTGNLIMEKNIRGLTDIELNTSILSEGYYILTLISKDKGAISHKIVKR